MKKELKDNPNFIYTIIYIMMSFSLIYLLSIILQIQLNEIAIFLTTLLIGVLIQVVLYFPFVSYFILLVGMGIFVLFYFISDEKALKIVVWFWQLIHNIFNHILIGEQIRYENARAFWLLLACCICFYTGFIIFKNKSILWLFPVYLISFLYYWYLYIDQAYSMMKLFFIFLLVLLGLQNYFAFVNSSTKDKKDLFQGRYKPWVKTAFVYGLIAVIMASVLPKRMQMIEMPWLENQILRHFPAITKFRDDVVYRREVSRSQLFHFSTTGFQPSTRELGGPVRLNDRIVMEVKSPYPLYLRGNVKDTYMQNYWTSRGTKERIIRTNEFLPKEINGEIITIEINYKDRTTTTLFTPYQPLMIIAQSSLVIRTDDRYQLTVQNPMRKGENYQIQVILPSGNHDLEKNHIQRNQDLQAYLQLPQGISDSIAQLAEEITQNLETPYEKALAIQNFLRENYNYSLEVPFTPRGREFVEYFLFESKEGYCTYFATAMAVMLRTQGIPSRYVEGYRMPQEREEGVYEIRQKNAHAWVEAFIEPMGWMTFEPTPAFEAPHNSILWHRYAAGDEMNPFIDEIDVEMLRERGEGRNLEELLPQEDLLPDVKNTNSSFFEGSLFGIRRITKFVLGRSLFILLFGLLPFRMGYMLWKEKNYFQKLKNKPPNQQIVYLYKNILQLMEILGYPVDTGETPNEYAQRVAFYVHGHQEDFKKLTHTYVVAKYSKNCIEQKEEEKFKAYLSYIDKKIRYQMGLWKYAYIKYIRGDMIPCFDLDLLSKKEKRLFSKFFFL